MDVETPQEEPQLIVESEPVEGEVVIDPISQPKEAVANRRPNGTFGPGNNANPRGAPTREWSWSGLIEKTAESYKETKFGGKKQWRELVVQRLFTEAANGNIPAIKEIFDRMDGKAAQNINLGGMQLPQPITDALTKALTPTDVSNNDSNKETK